MSAALLLLLCAALTPESTASSSEDSAGLKFVVVFPENIAYYHPSQPRNKLHVTALSESQVTVIAPGINKTYQLKAGQMEELIFDGKLELNKLRVSDRTIKITSDQKVTVDAVSFKNKSVQTALVIPTDQLGTRYFIPPVPTIQGTTDIVTAAVTERQPFRLIIVNTDQDNNVTLVGDTSTTVFLEPHQVGQVVMSADKPFQAVEAEHPLAVLFGQTCAIRNNCNCGLLYTMLPPAEEDKQKFYIPPVLASDAEKETFILLSNDGSTKVQSFDPDSSAVETAVTAVLYRPGLLLNLIPETDFAACCVINTVPVVESFAVIVVHKDHRDGVHVGSDPLQDPQWKPLKGTDYVSAKVVLSSSKNIIWHAYSKMAVYYVGGKGDMRFGNPAPIISKSTDYRGCVSRPETIHIGDVAGGWRESVKYCTEKGLELVSFSETDLQEQIYDKINQIKSASLREVWIGMRRRSNTGEWYWLNNEKVSDTDWAEEEPGTVEEGQCAMLSLDSSKNFGWRDEDCCKDARPVCYGLPVLFPMNVDDTP